MSSQRPAPNMVTRAAIWRAGLGRPRAKAIAWQPQPPWPGDPAAARRLAGGVLLLEGALTEAPGQNPWEVDPPGPDWEAALHGHGWLDDAASSPDRDVRAALKGWVFDWVARFGSGRGPGWAPELVARRVMRWIGHAPVLLSGAGREASEQLFECLGRQANHLASVWHRTPPGIARIEALAGLVYAGLSLEGFDRLADRTIGSLASELDLLVDEKGGIPSRNLEELAGIIELAVWTAGTIAESGRRLDRRLPEAVERMVPVLKALRHPDGTLARFQGARTVPSSRVEAILAGAGVKIAAPSDGAMGYRRMVAGPISLLLDGGPAPTGGHDSGLAFEIALGGQPAVVSAGSGVGFGAEAATWSRSGEAHSGVTLGGEPGAERGAVHASLTRDASGLWCLGESEARRRALGLVHERRLLLAAGGRRLSGEDTVLAPSASDRSRFGHLYPLESGRTCPIAVRFILHPSVKAVPALAGRAAVLTVPSGGRWMMRQSGGTLTLGETRYFDPGHLAPRPAREVLITGQATENWGRVTWSLECLDEGAIPSAPQASLFTGAPGDKLSGDKV